MLISIRSRNPDHLRIAGDLIEKEFPDEVPKIEYFPPAREAKDTEDTCLASASFSDAHDFRHVAQVCLTLADQCHTPIAFTYDGISMTINRDESLPQLEVRLMQALGYRSFRDNSASFDHEKLPIKHALYLAVSLYRLKGIDVFVNNPNGVSFVPKTAEEAAELYYTNS